MFFYIIEINIAQLLVKNSICV